MRSFPAIKYRLKEHFPLVLIVCLWCIGATFAYFTFLCAQPVYVSLMLGVSQNAMSIVGCVCVTILPFAILGIASYYQIPVLIYSLILAEGFLFSISSFALWAAFGSSGWLLQLLMYFSSNISILLVLFFSVYSFYYSRRKISLTFVICAGLSIFVGILDFLIISPFVTQIMHR